MHDAQHVFCIRFDNTQLISKKGIIGGVSGARQSFYAVCGGQRGATQCRFSSPCERRARPPEYVHKRGSQRTERESMHYVWRDRFSAVETAAQRDDGELVRSRSLSCTAPFARLGSPVCYSCRLGTLLQPTLLLLLLVPSPFGRAALAFSAIPKAPENPAALPWLLATRSPSPLTLDCCRGFWLMRTLTHGHAFHRKGEE